MNEKILKQPISTLGFSSEVEQACSKNNIIDLDGFLKHPYSELINMNGFDMRIMVEVITFLKKYSLQYLLKD